MSPTTLSTFKRGIYKIKVSVISFLLNYSKVLVYRTRKGLVRLIKVQWLVLMMSPRSRQVW